MYAKKILPSALFERGVGGSGDRYLGQVQSATHVVKEVVHIPDGGLHVDGHIVGPHIIVISASLQNMVLFHVISFLSSGYSVIFHKQRRFGHFSKNFLLPALY